MSHGGVKLKQIDRERQFAALPSDTALAMLTSVLPLLGVAAVAAQPRPTVDGALPFFRGYPSCWRVVIHVSQSVLQVQL